MSDGLRLLNPCSRSRLLIEQTGWAFDRLKELYDMAR